MKQRQSTHTVAKRVLCKGAITAFLFLVGMFLYAPLSHAQLMNTGTINGTVVDQSGSVVPGA